MIFLNKKVLRTLSLILAVFMILSPISIVLADINWQNNHEESDDTDFFESMGNVIDYLKMDFLKIIPYYQVRNLGNLFGFRKREKLPVGDLVETELAKALQALNNFGAAILKDDRLVEAMEDIIGDLLDKDDFTRGVQERKDFAADIIRDDRLINIIGEVIADYLKDEQMAEDIEFFFTIALDLIADKNIQAYIKETIARMVENPKTAELVDGIIASVAQIIYNTATGTIANITSDPRIKEIIKDISAIFIEPIPDMIADIVEDDSIKNASEDILRILLEFGPNITADILEDEEFRSLITDIVTFTVDFSVTSATATMRDENLARIIFGVTENLSDAIGTGTLNNIVTTLVDDFFKSDEFRAFIDPGFQYLIAESSQRASDNTIGDSIYIPSFDLELNLGKEIAFGIAEVPPEIIYLGFFDWLVYGKDDLDARTYSEWAAQFTNLITSDFVEDVGKALAFTVGKEVPRLIDENKELLFEDLKEITENLPYDKAVEFFREDENMRNFPAVLAEAVINFVPFDYIAETLRDDEEVINTFQIIVNELIDEFPLHQVGEFIQNDKRINDLMGDAIPDMPLKEIAEYIRNDELFWSLVTDIAKTLPVKPISQFLQEGLRADIIGHTIADLLLNLAADFVSSHQLTDYLHTIINNIMQSFDDPVAKIILDSVARFLENDELSPILATSVVGVFRETEFELHDVYKKVVPRFFTRLITGK